MICEDIHLYNEAPKLTKHVVVREDRAGLNLSLRPQFYG